MHPLWVPSDDVEGGSEVEPRSARTFVLVLVLFIAALIFVARLLVE